MDKGQVNPHPFIITSVVLLAPKNVLWVCINDYLIWQKIRLLLGSAPQGFNMPFSSHPSDFPHFVRKQGFNMLVDHRTNSCIYQKAIIISDIFRPLRR